MKSIRTLKQDRSKAKTSLKSVLSLQVNINIPKIEKDHQKKMFGNNRQKRRLCLEELSEKHQKTSSEKSSKKINQIVHIIVRKIKFSVYAQPFMSFLELSK